MVISLASKQLSSCQQQQRFDIVYLASMQFCFVSFACLNGVKAFKDVWYECAQAFFSLLDILPRTSTRKREVETNSFSNYRQKSCSLFTRPPSERCFSQILVFVLRLRKTVLNIYVTTMKRAGPGPRHELWPVFQVQMAFQIERISILLQIRSRAPINSLQTKQLR